MAAAELPTHRHGHLSIVEHTADAQPGEASDRVAADQAREHTRARDTWAVPKAMAGKPVSMRSVRLGL